MLDGIEDAQAGISAIARQQDHFDVLFVGAVEPQKFLHQPERGSFGEKLVLVFDLIALVGVHALLDEDAVTLREIEQRAGRDSDNQLIGKRRLWHAPMLTMDGGIGYRGAQNTAPSSSQPHACDRPRRGRQHSGGVSR